MAMMYYTYAHIRPDTGVIFNVGKGNKKRAYSKHSRNDHWHYVVNKNDGIFEVRILNWFNNEDDAYASEEWQISQLEPLGNLVNKTPGGEGVRGECISGLNNPMHRPECKVRMFGDTNPMRNPENAKKAADKNRGQKRSPEFCEKFQGENNPMFGKTQSDKQKQAVSASQLGKPKGYSQRTKTSAKVSGKNNGMFGKTGSLNPMFGKVSAMKGRSNPMAAFANYIRYIPYWGA
jgi:hypothetical protein